MEYTDHLEFEEQTLNYKYESKEKVQWEVEFCAGQREERGIQTVSPPPVKSPNSHNCITALLKAADLHIFSYFSSHHNRKRKTFSKYLKKRPFLSRTTSSSLLSGNRSAGTLKWNLSSQTGSRLSFTNSVFRLRDLSGRRVILTNGSGRCEAGLSEMRSN